jgi:hypothetical protein
MKPVAVAQAYNPRYLGGRAQGDHNLRPGREKFGILINA